MGGLSPDLVEFPRRSHRRGPLRLSSNLGRAASPEGTSATGEPPIFKMSKLSAFGNFAATTRGSLAELRALAQTHPHPAPRTHRAKAASGAHPPPLMSSPSSLNASIPPWKRTAGRLALALAAAIAALPALRADDFFIHDGDRVVFLGDSITEQRLYTTYIEAYALTRHPKWNLWFRNSGWGGDTAWLRQRFHTDEAQLFAADEASQQSMVKKAVDFGLDRDVLPLRPTVVTVDFGMNDHLYQAFRPDVFRAFIASQEEIGRVLGNNGSRVAYLTPQPIEEKRTDPDQDIKNLSLRKFSDGLRDVAHDEKGLYADEFAPYMQTMLHSAAGYRRRARRGPSGTGRPHHHGLGHPEGPRGHADGVDGDPQPADGQGGCRRRLPDRKPEDPGREHFL